MKIESFGQVIVNIHEMTGGEWAIQLRYYYKNVSVSCKIRRVPLMFYRTSLLVMLYGIVTVDRYM